MSLTKSIFKVKSISFVLLTFVVVQTLIACADTFTESTPAPSPLNAEAKYCEEDDEGIEQCEYPQSYVNNIDTGDYYIAPGDRVVIPPNQSTTVIIYRAGDLGPDIVTVPKHTQTVPVGSPARTLTVPKAYGGFGSFGARTSFTSGSSASGGRVGSTGSRFSGSGTSSGRSGGSFGSSSRSGGG